MKLEKVLMNHDKVESFLVNTNNDLVVYGKSLMFQVLLSGVEIEGITLTSDIKIEVSSDVERKENKCMYL
jgi:hypothetical protein